MKLIGLLKYSGVLVAVSLLLGNNATALEAPTIKTEVKTCSARTSVAKRPVLQIGDSGSCVREAQARLRAKGYTVAVDGQFGPATRQAVVRFQAAYGISRTGNVGPKTWTKLVAKRSRPRATPQKFIATRCGNNGSKVLLVFDDYPVSSQAWRSLIDTAKKHRIGIGVAPNGMYVRSGVADVNYARKRGMLVVDHGYTHDDMSRMSYRQVVWQITRPHVRSNYVRPPYGAYNSTVTRAFKDQGKYTCLWNLDPQDWNRKSPKSAADYIIRNAIPGSSVVVHLNHMGKQPNLLPYIKKGLARRDIAMCQPWSNSTPEKMGPVYCK